MGKGGGGGGQQQAQPTTQTVQQTNLPAWAQPYSEKLLGKAEALTDINTNPYQSYSGQRLAGFTPMQQQAFGNIGNMGVSEQTGMGTGLAGLAGLGGLNAQNNYTQTATNPGAMAAYMSPYMQNVVDWQKQQAINDYGRALPGLGAAAAQRGAFGGSRQALVESEAQRNLQNQLAGIQATGTQNAFQQAQQAQQFGAGLGMQGLGLAGQAAGQLGQLGQQQYGQQMGINAAQQQAGAQQQAFEQQGLTNQYQDFLNKMNYPYQQLSFMSDILHGTPTGGITTSQQTQAQPSMFSQIAGLGLGLGALGKGFGMFKDGGAVKGYAEGGSVKTSPGIAAAYLTDHMDRAPNPQETLLADHPPAGLSPELLALIKANQMVVAQARQQPAQPPASTVAQDIQAKMAGLTSLPAPNLDQEDSFADGGIIAFAEGGDMSPATAAYQRALGDTWASKGLNRLGAGIADIVAMPGQLAYDWDHYRRSGELKPKYQTQGLFPILASQSDRESGEQAQFTAAQEAARKVPSRFVAPAAGIAASLPYGMSPRKDLMDKFGIAAAAPEQGSQLQPQASEAPVARPAPKVAAPVTPVAPAQAKPTTTPEEDAAMKTLTTRPEMDFSAGRKAFEARMEEVAPSKANEIREFYKSEGEKLKGEGDRDRWLALAMGGFAVAAGKSPYAIQNFGAGLGLAAKEISTVNKEIRAAEAARSKAERAEMQADRAEQLGKLKAAQAYEDQQRQFAEAARGHEINAANTLITSRDRLLGFESQERVHAADRASRERVANMQAAAMQEGKFNLAQQMYTEYNAAKTPAEQAAVVDKYKNFSAALGKTSGVESAEIAASRAFAVKEIENLQLSPEYQKADAAGKARMVADIKRRHGFGGDTGSSGKLIQNPGGGFTYTPQ